MGRRGGGGRAGDAWIGRCVPVLAGVAATLVVCALVIRGAGGLKQYHAPAFARKVLLSITSGHSQDNLNIVLHPSQLQNPGLQSSGLIVKSPAATSRRVNIQQERYAPRPTISHRSQATPPSHMISPSIQIGHGVPYPHLHEQVPAASPSHPVPPHSPRSISVDTPAVAPFSQQPSSWLAIPPVPTTSPPVFPHPRRSYPPLPARPHPHRQAVPPSVIHPANHGKAQGVPAAAPSKERHHHSIPVNNTHENTHVGPVVAPPMGRHHHALPDPPIHLQILPVSIEEDMAFQLLHLQRSIPESYLLQIIGTTKGTLHMLHVTPMNITHLQILQNLSYHLCIRLTVMHLKSPRLWHQHPNHCHHRLRVHLRLGIALFTFFALVSELAQDIASGVFMEQSQVRVMGANAATEDPEKTVVLIDLVPLAAKFDNATAFLVFERFWHKQVNINRMHFGNYDVLYVQYQGLPPSPPTAPGMNNGLSNVNDPRLHPLAVDVGNHRETKSRGIVVIVVLSSVFAFILCSGAALVIYFKIRSRNHLIEEESSMPPKPTGPGSVIVGSRLGSRPISASPSFSSSIVTYKGTAKTFSLIEMERATQRFDKSRIIGEGGFGRVYEGILEDGERVAVKILKRDDQQGTREFLAEVEMLSRLHHRNLVKLIGICTEEHIRCLVYELVPNGSVESHLHGSDKGTAPLDWDARLKIALGAARALAYLHEDSSPRVIHRDFKSSNILLEHDFTPKVSDFGLARSAIGEGNEHISTRVMGTFGYVAPEYAMTGHLLVKSDVYSYGVVLLELLTGRKPVDMLRPPGQENLVAWACPFLTSRDGLETIIDPSLGNNIPFDSIAKVAAIASMCVQPEVDQRPFMGEVVQALKLVCDEGSDFNESRSFSQDLHIQDSGIISRASLDMAVEPVLSAELFNASARYDTLDASGSFRRYSSSGPLRVGRTAHNRERGLSTGSSSEHCGTQRFRIDSE
uniref:Protein kinase domain-containing protein n=1 Tax=Leersia perrieri TaxID=77586 RepID=A0A0D9V4T4_9ORYZ